MGCARTRLILRFFHRQEDRHFPNAFEGWDLASWGAGPAVQGPLGMSTAGREAKSSASGQGAAKARRTRLAISTTRAAILSNLRRSVANSALARSRDLGMAWRTASVGSHLGLRISNFAPKKPSNVRISTINILTFDGLASPLERQAELSRIGVRTLFAPVGSSHPEQR